MKQINFEWYVLNQEWNTKKIRPYNIFNNINVLEATNKLCVDYKRKKMSFEDFTEELRKIIQWQEWSRIEYEIAVSSLWAESWEDYEKVDCYQQALPNINIISKYVLEEYYPRLKINLHTDEEDLVLKKEHKISETNQTLIDLINMDFKTAKIESNLK